MRLPSPLERVSLAVAAGLTLATLPGSEAPPQPAVGYFQTLGETALSIVGSTDPNTARMAIVTGLTCNSGTVAKTYTYDVSEGRRPATALVLRDATETWSMSAAAALYQYRNDTPDSKEVMWDGGTATQVFQKTPNGYKNKGMGTMLVRGSMRDYDPEAYVPNEAIDKGYKVLVYRVVDVTTGSKEAGFTNSVGKIPCGAFKNENGKWEKDPDLMKQFKPSVETCAQNQQGIYTEGCSDSWDGAGTFGPGR
jgi:hypothetical protein